MDTLVAPEEFDNRLVIGVNKKDSRGQGVEGTRIPVKCIRKKYLST